MTISDDDLKRLDDRYVTKAECEIKQDKVQADIASMRADMAVMCESQKATNKWLGIIATAVITGLVGFVLTKIFGG